MNDATEEVTIARVRLRTQPLVRNVDNLYDLADDRTRRHWLWSTSFRRLLYGLPHRYRSSQHDERRDLMSIFLGLQLILGGAAAVLGAALLQWRPQHGHGYHTNVLLSLGALSFALGVAMLGGPLPVVENRRKPARFPFWSYHVIVLTGGLLISLYCFFLRDLAVYGGLFFLWGAAYSFTFFSNWRAVLYVVLSSGAFDVVLHLRDIPAASVATSFQFIGSLLVGVSLGVVVSREWSYREGTLLELAELAHDLRRPLSNILLRRRDPGLSSADRDRLMDTVDHMAEDAEDVLVSLADLLDMARFELSGDDSIDRHQLDLVPTVQREVGYAAVPAASNGKTIQVDSAVDTCIVYADQRKAERIISNLLDNATKYARSQVTVTIWESPGGASVRVADDGPGTGDTNDEQMFRPFLRGKDAQHPGHGLGLAVARTYARQHGGDVVRESPALGASFVWRLPRPARPTLNDPAADGNNRESRTGFRKVLVLDDDRSTLLITQRILRRQGFHVVLSSEGRAAMALLARQSVDLVLVDIRLRNEDGAELLPRLRAVAKGRPSFVAYTSGSELGAQRQYRALGFDGFVAKPLPETGLDDATRALAYSR